MPRVIFSGAAAWVTLGVLLAALSWAGWSQWRINKLHERLGQAQAAIDTAVSAADNNRVQLHACAGRLDGLLDDLRLSDEAQQRATARLAAETERRQALARLDTDRRSQTSDAARETGASDPVCPAVADSLRRAARGHRDWDCRGARALSRACAR